MLGWEILGEDLLWIEIYTGIAFLIFVGVWVFWSRIPAAFVGFAITVGLIAFGSLRPFNYNSDTENYYSYVYYLSFVNDSKIFFLTKLEPLHSLLILLLQDFKIWLLAESAVMAVGLFLAYNARRNDFSFLVLCAFVLTLGTSSLRYCSALIYFFYFISRSEMGVIKATRTTAVLMCIHISMIMAGALALRRRLMLLGISAICIAIFLESSLLGSRIVVDITQTSRGFKAFGVAMIAVGYLFSRSPRRGLNILPFYIIMFISFFLVSSEILTVFNRFLIMGTLFLVAVEWPALRRNDESDIFDRGFTLLITGAIILPHLINLPRLFYSGAW